MYWIICMHWIFFVSIELSHRIRFVFKRHGQPPGPLWQHILHRTLQRRCAVDTTISVPGVLQSGHAQVAVRHTVLLSFSGFLDVRWGSRRYPAGQWRIRSKSTYVYGGQSWDSPVGIVIRLSDGRQANSDIIPGRRKRFFSSPKLSDQLWDPPV